MTKSSPYLLAVLLALSAPVAHGGVEHGNGGDPCEDRIKSIRDDIRSWIDLGGAAGLKFPAGVTLDVYTQSMKAQMAGAGVSCVEEEIYVGTHQKTCKNFVDSRGISQIQCNITRFMRDTTDSEQYVLVHHEYAGLSGFEATDTENSIYPLSDQVTHYLEDQKVKKLAIHPVFQSVIDPKGLNFVPIPLKNGCDHPIADGQACFLMGSSGAEVDRAFNEHQHEVLLSRSFEMQTTDVTQDLWFEVMGSNPSRFQYPANCPKTFELGTQEGAMPLFLCPYNPVEQVSFEDAAAFIQKLNARQKAAGDPYTYALPTEAQWEYAARAGTQTEYIFGGDSAQLDAHAWYAGNSQGTHEVATRPANGFGLYDMAGNVWQWVSDEFAFDYGVDARKKADPVGPTTGSMKHTVRGGSWAEQSKSLRAAYRGYGDAESRYDDLGFRLVRTR